LLNSFNIPLFSNAAIIFTVCGIILWIIEEILHNTRRPRVLKMVMLTIILFYYLFCSFYSPDPEGLELERVEDNIHCIEEGTRIRCD
jgi:hypothetical protein